MDANVTQGKGINGGEKCKGLQKEITQVDNSLELPAYSGMQRWQIGGGCIWVVEHCSKEEQGFVYDIIRQNFLVGNTGSMTEEERAGKYFTWYEKSGICGREFLSRKIAENHYVAN
ncbi:hypothetical protein [Roseburia intestinalis]